MSRQGTLGLALGAALLVTPPDASLHAADGPMRFAARVIAERLPAGYQTLAVDMNRDGRLDVVALALSRPTDLVWFENPGWARHVIGTFSDMINVAAADIDGDGVPELGLAHGFTTSPATRQGTISLLTSSRPADGGWSRRDLDRVPTSHRLRWWRVDGRGRIVLVNAPLVGPGATPPEYRARNAILYYEPPDWNRQVLTDGEEGVLHGIHVGRAAAGGAGRLLSASFLGIFEHAPRGASWTRTQLTRGAPDDWPKSGASDVTDGLHGGEPFLAAIEPWHGHQVVAYHLRDGAWARQVLDTGLSSGHAIAAGDLAGSGRDAIVAGSRGAGGGLFIYWPPPVLGDPWARQVLNATNQASSCDIADLNADGRRDVLCIAANEPGLVWYENLGPLTP